MLGINSPNCKSMNRSVSEKIFRSLRINTSDNGVQELRDEVGYSLQTMFLFFPSKTSVCVSLSVRRSTHLSLTKWLTITCVWPVTTEHQIFFNMRSCGLGGDTLGHLYLLEGGFNFSMLRTSLVGREGGFNFSISRTSLVVGYIGKWKSYPYERNFKDEQLNFKQKTINILSG